MRARPHIITLSSHVAYGAVGNRTIVPTLENLGLQVTAVPTVQLSWHPGMNAKFGPGQRQVPQNDEFAAMVESLAHAPWLHTVDGIISGYLGDAAQAKPIAALVEALKTSNPAAVYLCDPVIGDTGGLYVPETTAIAIRDELWPLADIVTPNLFEFGWMCGGTFLDKEARTGAARTLRKRAVLITSAITSQEETGSLLVVPDSESEVTHQRFESVPNGTGDMLAASFMAHIQTGHNDKQSLYLASMQVFAAIKQAKAIKSDSLSVYGSMGEIN